MATVPSLADHLLALDAEALHAWFTQTPAVEITDRIRETDEADLARLIADDGVRAEAVTAILDRFAEFADHERLGMIRGTVRFDLTRGGTTDSHTVRIGHGVVQLRADHPTPEVVIGAAMPDFVRLVTGQRNAALLYLSDQLQLTGDEMLALDVGTVFHLPGLDRVAVDPRALDAYEVATAVTGTSTAHLRKVMASGFRSIVLDEVVRRFPEFLDVERSRKLDLSVGFRVLCSRDTEPERFVVHVEHGVCRIEAAESGGSGRRDATISIDGADFLRLITGQLNPVKGVLTGALKVRGDRAKALALNAVMTPPRAR